MFLTAASIFIFANLQSYGSPDQGHTVEQLTAVERFESVPKELIGDWSLNLESGEPAWLRIEDNGGRPRVYMRVYVGPDGPYSVNRVEKGRVYFFLKPKRTKRKTVALRTEVEVGVTSGNFTGSISHLRADGTTKQRIKFTGDRIPPMPSQRPDLEAIRFGQPKKLFNGKDLTGWRPHEADKINGWKVVDGCLVNETPKTDFSATGAHANLRTKEEFGDFRLHIEFLVQADRNSGVYLRGMYEAQVVDRDSRMQGIQGVGSIFGRIAPATNAGLAGGNWQAYDLTLVDRHITVVLNGTKVIDNQPIEGPTAGAIYTNPALPGPIYLQGDHTSVKYRNIYLEPRLKNHGK